MTSSPLVPAHFDWAVDAVGLYQRHFAFFAVVAAAYLPTIFGLQWYLKDKPALDLGGFRSSSRVNWIFWWEAGLAVFSLTGLAHMLPQILDGVARSGSVSGSICSTDMATDPRAFWGLLFALSKVVEFGDTLLVVLRKKPLIFLQYYHHLVTMCYCWYGARYVQSFNNTSQYYAVMNYLVHSIMYTWYAATRMGWRSPRWMMMGVTFVQLAQMFAGVWITVIASAASGPCGKWRQESPRGVAAAAAMYFSYVLLFGHMFWSKYCVKKPKKPAANGAAVNGAAVTDGSKKAD